MKTTNKSAPEIHIRSADAISFLSIAEIIRFRDLLFALCRREILAPYKQSILGPAWFVLIPFISSVIFTLIFGNLAQLSTDGHPKYLFYLCGAMCWALFSESFSATSNTFQDNAQLFGKVYFPRVIPPMAKLAMNVTRFFVQLVFFAGFWIYYDQFTDYDLTFNPWSLLIVPAVVFIISANALAFGLILAALNSKYRDFKQIHGFAVGLWMFVTPVVYPLSMVPERYQLLASINPLTPIFEIYRYVVLGEGTISMDQCLLSLGITATLLMIGMMLFARVEKNFMDTV